MSHIDGSAFVEFFTQWYPKMIRICERRGASRVDAQDAACAVVMSIWTSWPHWNAAENKTAYMRAAVINELSRTRKKQASQQAATQSRWGQDIRKFELPDSAADGYERGQELDVVRQCLAISPRRRREILARLYLEFRPAEIARN